MAGALAYQERKKAIRHSIILSFIARILWFYLHFVGKTSKIVLVGKEHEEKLEKSGRPYIFAFWHGRQAILIYVHRNIRVSPLVSPSRDGDLAAKLLSLFGITSVRGSSRKKPAAALRQLMNQVEKGYSLGITPDGPLGPEGQVKVGTLYIAKELSIPILPLSASFKKKTRLKSWDTFLFPFPFNRVVVTYGEPMTISQEDNLEEKAGELKKVLNELTEQADVLADSL